MSERKRGIQHVRGGIRTSSQENLRKAEAFLKTRRQLHEFTVVPVNGRLYAASYYFTYGPCKNDGAQWSDTMKLMQDLHSDIRMEHWINVSSWEPAPEVPFAPPTHELTIRSATPMTVVS